METQPHSKPATLTMTVSSSAFGANGSIPVEHTAHGANVAPPLSWSTPPPGTRSVAVVVEDLDVKAGPFVHWIVVGIRPVIGEFPVDQLPTDAIEGINDFGVAGWRGPDPKGSRHRYVFRVYALDNVPKKIGMTKSDLMRAISGHTLAEGELIGTYDPHD